MAQVSAKRQQIDKSMSVMVRAASIAVFVTIFSLVSAHSLLTKLSFQDKLITAKTTARNQLTTDVAASQSLSKAYNNFNDAQTNLLGGSVTNEDSDNAKVILDALPSSYDFPALTTSLQKLLTSQGVNVDSIGGSDLAATNSSTTGGSAVSMPFTFSVDGPYQNLQNLINSFEKSIRPFQFLSLNFSGNQSDVTLSASAQTFYQPSTSFKITTTSVK